MFPRKGYLKKMLISKAYRLIKKDKISNYVVFGVHESGRGKIVYMADNPLFRGFWYNGKLLFGNAIFIVSS